MSSVLSVCRSGYAVVPSPFATRLTAVVLTRAVHCVVRTLLLVPTHPASDPTFLQSLRNHMYNGPMQRQLQSARPRPARAEPHRRERLETTGGQSTHGRTATGQLAKSAGPDGRATPHPCAVMKEYISSGIAHPPSTGRCSLHRLRTLLHAGLQLSLRPRPPRRTALHWHVVHCK